MYIDRLLVQKEAPKDTKVAWGIPQGENVAVNVHVDGKWRPIAGSGNSTTVTKYTSDPNAPMLSMDNVYAQMNLIAERLGISSGEPTQEQTEQVMNELKSYKFATPKQGNAVLLDHDLENNIFTFQCEDGSLITFTDDNQGMTTITGLRLDIDGYIIWKTTRDKLPVRESQEETDPDKPNPGDVKDTKSVKSVKSGLLGDTAPTDPSTEEVYTVIDNNTGEIVDPLELHKLTNVIWYYYYGGYYPFYLQEVTDFYSYTNDIISNDSYISTWVCTRSYATILSYTSISLYYDYTLNPVNMSRINTTNHSEVSNIDAFFNY